MKSGHADLPLHYGKVPKWLAQRMSALGGAIVESIVVEYGRQTLLSKMSDPCWFQSLGCVLGMDWHSSGITTSVMGALKRSVNERASELGIFICGGRGKQSLQTPNELSNIANKLGLAGDTLIRNSKLAAKVDNTAVQDGFQLYLHSFILSKDGDWAIIQQGMNTDSRMARRYHWHSAQIKSFVEEPHSFIYGRNQGLILNLTHKDAKFAKQGILALSKERPESIVTEARKIMMPRHHDVKSKDVNLKRLGSVLSLAQERGIEGIEDLLLLEGMGPRTLQSLTLISEVIHGTLSRFDDPARFSFAHGGKDGYPFPVPVKTYDESIQFLQHTLEKAKIGYNEKSLALKNLFKVAEQRENDFVPNNNFEEVIKQERAESWKYGGRTVFGRAEAPKFKILKETNTQLSLF